MKRLLLLFPLTFLLACTFEKGETAMPVGPQDCVEDTVIHVVNVTMNDDFFSPALIEIAVGDTVNWSYPTGTSAHTATCDGSGGTTLPSGGTSFDSGILTAGGSFKKAISGPGTYSYICTIHGAAMTGTIVVKPRCQ